MDFTNPSLTLLSKSTSQTSSTFIDSTSRLTSLSPLTLPLLGPNSKQILISKDSLILTSNTNMVLETLKPYPIYQVLKMNADKLTDSSSLMVNLCAILMAKISVLVHQGMSRKKIALILKSIKKDLKSFVGFCKEMSLNSDLNDILFSLVKNKEVRELLIKALKQISSDTLQDFVKDLDDRIRVVKVNSGTLNDSFVVSGMVFKGEPVTLKKTGTNLKSSIFNCPIEISKTTTKGTILLENAEELKNFSLQENMSIKNTITDISKNADLIICNGKIDEQYVSYLNEENKIAFSIYSKHDIRRLRNGLGGCISPVLRDVRENGTCSEMSVFEEGNSLFTKIAGSNVSTILMKSPVRVLTDEYERMINKAIKVLMKNSIKGKISMIRDYERKLADKLMNEKVSDSRRFVYQALAEALENVAVKGCESVFDVYECKIKAVQYAIEVVCVALETEDFMFVRGGEMNIKPRTNSHWDED